MEKNDKQPQKPAKEAFKEERAERGDVTESPAAEQLGGTEKQVTPLTPPMARSDEQPGDRKLADKADEEIDPADELTPG